jgi:RHS repeat-associated protein
MRICGPWLLVDDPFGTATANQNPSGIGPFIYNVKSPGQVYMPETGLNQNLNRDYDPLTGRYVESDPTGLGGGINTYAYADSSPGMGVDPLGLFQLGWSETWSRSNNLGSVGGDSRGGLSEGWIENVHCTCTRSGDCWSLQDCSALFHVKVQILANATGRQEEFFRQSEAQHVADFRAGFGTISEAGQSTEDAQKKMHFSSKAACEASTSRSVGRALWNAANSVAMASGRTYDETGRHTWHWYYRFFGQ